MSSSAINPDFKQYILEMEYLSHIDINRQRVGGTLEVEFEQIGPYKLISTNAPADFVNRVIGKFDASLFDYFSEIKKWFSDRKKDVILAIYPDSSNISTFNQLIDQGFQLSSYMSYWLYHLDDFNGETNENCKIISDDSHNLFVEVGMKAVGTPREDDFYEISEELFRRYCKVDHTENYLYYSNNQAVGTGTSHYVKDTVYLLNGAVIPSHRGQHIQQELIITRLAKAKALGMKYAITSTDLDSTSGRNMERLGFQKAFTIAHLRLRQ